MKTNYFKLLIFLAMAVMTGCTTAPFSTSDKGIQNKPGDSLAEAKALHQQGNWADAIRILQQAQKAHPESTAINNALENLQQAWQHEKETLYQHLLIAETQALLDQQKILRNISSNGPTDIKAKTGLLLKGVQLEGKIDELNHCIDYQKQHNLELANTCGELVHKIEQSEDSKKRYEAINRTYQYALQQTRKINKQQSGQQLLKEAENLIQKGAYLEAQVLLEEVITLSPENSHARQLMQKLDSTLKQQAEILFSVGDQLYRDGQLEQAVAVWQSLLKLTPDNTSVKARIERAEHVLNKLQSLRREQADTQRIKSDE